MPLDTKQELKALLGERAIQLRNNPKPFLSKSFDESSDEFDEFGDTRADATNPMQSTTYIMSASSNCLNLISEKAESKRTFDKDSEIVSEEVKLEARKK